MKANELMIGDWVMVNDIEHTHPLQVAEIFKKSGAYYATLYWDGMPYNVNPETLTADVDKVLPIPLTPEILEKNGFKLDKEDGWWWLSPKIGIIFWEECDIELEFENKHSSVNIHINYLHQLQQALRLCGIEKEIEL